MFTFRGKGKNVPPGQYEFPFTFILPEKIPSSFQFINARGENFQIKYLINVYFEDYNDPILRMEKEIKVL